MNKTLGFWSAAFATLCISTAAWADVAPPQDSGTGGTAGTAGTAGNGTGGNGTAGTGTGGTKASSSDDSGCSVSGHSGGSSAPALLLTLAGLALVRRRRH